MNTDFNEADLRFSRYSSGLLRAAESTRLRTVCLRLALRLEGGQLYSGTARAILNSYFGVAVGAYSYGPCFVPGSFQPHSAVGRYVSIAPGVRAYRRNHPINTLSTHPFFFNSALGVLESDAIGYEAIEIGADAWIGANVVITPNCRRIGIGSIVAAGAVVTKDVPDFGICGGVPARLLRYRFESGLCDEILSTCWWERSVAELKDFLPTLTEALDDSPARVELFQNLRRSARRGCNEQTSSMLTPNS